MAREKNHSKIRDVIVLILLLAVLLACAISAQLYARYITSFDTQYFSLNVDAGFKVTFDAGEGTMRYPAQQGGRWLEVASTSATKKIRKGETLGWNGLDNTDFPGNTSADANAPVREGYTFGGWSESRLPAGYTEVEYIEVKNENGYKGAFIDTGYAVTDENQNKIRIEVKGTFTGGEKTYMVDGIGGQADRLIYVGVNDGMLYYGENGKGDRSAGISVDGSKVNTIYADYYAKVAGCNGDSVPLVSGTTKAAARNLYLYKWNKLNGAGSYHTGRKYYVKIWNAGVLVRDFIPCIRQSDSAIGMYDAAGEDFYKNAATVGQFTAGPVKGTGGSKTSESVMEASEDVIIRALWIPNEYTVTLNTNDAQGSTRATGSTASGNIKVTYDGTYSNLPTLKRDGYTFTGWWDSPQGGNEYLPTAPVKITDDIELYAQWEANKYKVTFDQQGGTSDIPFRTVTFDEKYGELSTPSRAGYEFAGWWSSLVPYEYQEVEYLQSDGKQFIDTGVTINKENRLHLKVEIKGTYEGSGWRVDGIGSPANEFVYVGVNNGYAAYGCMTMDHVTEIPVSQTEMNVYSVDYLHGKLRYNDTVEATVLKELSAESSYNYYIFGWNPGSTHTGKKAYVKMWMDDVLIRDMIPCYRKSDKKPGMFDKVSGEFFINKGTEEFTVGKDVYSGDTEGSLVTAETMVTTPGDHTLYAKWRGLPTRTIPADDIRAELEKLDSNIMNNATAWERADVLPYAIKTGTKDTDYVLINDDNPDEPKIYVWKNGTEVLWFTDSETVYMDEDCSGLFSGCTNLTTLNLKGWDASKTTDVSYMFSDCVKLTTIKTSGSFVNDGTINSLGMFTGCEKLTGGNGFKWDADNPTDGTHAVLDSFDEPGYFTYIAAGEDDAVTIHYDANYSKAAAIGFTQTVKNGDTFTAGGAAVQANPAQTNYVLYRWNTKPDGSGIDYKIGDRVDTDNFKKKNGETANAGGRSITLYAKWGTPKRISAEGTLYFTVDEKTYEAGDTYDGKKIGIADNGVAAFARGDKVFDDSVTSAVITEDFALFKPTTMGYWFKNCNQLVTISGTQYIDTSNVTNMTQVFMGCSSLENIEDVSGWNTSKVTSMTHTFYACSKLEFLDVSKWDTSSVTGMSHMFHDCKKLKVLDVSNWNTAKVTGMAEMFRGCESLETLDVSNWDTGNVANISFMFAQSFKVETIDVSKWNTAKVSDMRYLFYGCSSIKELDLSGWEFSLITSLQYVFGGCTSLETIYASEDLKKDQITVSSDLFTSCNKLRAGNGSVYPIGAEKDMTYAVIDRDGAPGYLTYGGVNVDDAVVIHYDNRNVGGDMPAFTQQVKAGTAFTVGGAGGQVASPSSAIEDVDNVYTFRGWSFEKTADEETVVYPRGSAAAADSARADVVMYAQCKWEDATPATFITGSSFGSQIQKNPLSIGSATEIKRVYRMPADFNPEAIDTGKYINMSVSADNPVWFWRGEGESIIYYYSAADRINLNPNSAQMFYHCGSSIQKIDMTGWNTSEVTSMANMFDTCSGLTELDLSYFDCSKNTTSSVMFWGCSKLSKLTLPDGFISAANKTIASMFSGCSSLTELDTSTWDTSGVTDMSNAFNGCGIRKLDLSNFDTSQVTSIAKMFYGCSRMEELDLCGFNTTKINDMNNLFWHCTSLNHIDISSFDTSNVTSMAHMFDNCPKLIELDLSNFDTSKVTSMDIMFWGCSKLKTIYVDSDRFKTDLVPATDKLFEGCASLTGGEGSTLKSVQASGVSTADSCMTAYARVDGGTDAPGYFTYKEYIPEETIPEVQLGRLILNLNYKDREIVVTEHGLE